ncbi:MAG TPA: DNA repair protein RecN [Casimicrobiaceae bacterium]|nr:DNA repair protein RecN [Casimicrobiaceae bacterium]
MLRLLSIRNFVVVEALELELEGGLSVLTGETGAGKSILLDALGLLLGDRFELRQLRPGSERAELAAEFGISDQPDVGAWLAGQDLAGDGETLLLRRTLDSDGRSRAWINGRPATLAQLKEAGERLVDLHGQHAHQSLTAPDVQRGLVDAFGGFAVLTRETAAAWREWRTAAERCESAAQAARASAAEREALDARHRDLASLDMSPDEWVALSQQQSRLAHAATLLEAASAAEDALAESDEALGRRLSAVTARLAASAARDPALSPIVALLEPARIQIDEAARALRRYRQTLDLDPRELARVEERLAAIHDVARKHRVRPEALPDLLADTKARLAALAESADASRLAARAAEAQARYEALARQLSAKREFAAHELEARVTDAMQQLAMAGGRLEIALEPLPTPAAYGCEQIEFRVASHPKQPLGPLSKVASGGELSRIALAIQVVTSEVAAVPTLVFDEVDAGIGGAVAATVGRLLQELGAHRQVLCVTHLPQVATFADAHFRVTKHGDDATVRADVETLDAGGRVEELARMLAGSAITAKSRAHAKELLAQHRRR